VRRVFHEVAFVRSIVDLASSTQLFEY